MILRHKPRSNEIKQLPYLEESIISRLAMTYLLITVIQMKEVPNVEQSIDANRVHLEISWPGYESRSNSI